MRMRAPKESACVCAIAIQAIAIKTAWHANNEATIYGNGNCAAAACFDGTPLRRRQRQRHSSARQSSGFTCGNGINSSFARWATAASADCRLHCCASELSVRRHFFCFPLIFICAGAVYSNICRSAVPSMLLFDDCNLS